MAWDLTLGTSAGTGYASRGVQGALLRLVSFQKLFEAAEISPVKQTGP